MILIHSLTYSSLQLLTPTVGALILHYKFISIIIILFLFRQTTSSLPFTYPPTAYSSPTECLSFFHRQIPLLNSPVSYNFFGISVCTLTRSIFGRECPTVKAIMSVDPSVAPPVGLFPLAKSFVAFSSWTFHLFSVSLDAFCIKCILYPIRNKIKVGLPCLEGRKAAFRQSQYAFGVLTRLDFPSIQTK